MTHAISHLGSHLRPRQANGGSSQYVHSRQTFKTWLCFHVTVRPMWRWACPTCGGPFSVSRVPSQSVHRLEQQPVYIISYLSSKCRVKSFPNSKPLIQPHLSFHLNAYSMLVMSAMPGLGGECFSRISIPGPMECAPRLDSGKICYHTTSSAICHPQ